jgi:hypothetical protein
MSTNERTDAETWARIRELQADEDAKEIAAMSSADVDAELRAGGIDPEKVVADGLAFIAGLRERHVRLGWQTGAKAKLQNARALESQVRGMFAALPRAELIARIEAARHNPRFGGQVGAMFRKRTAAESSDDQLRAILEELTLAERLQGGSGEGGETP